jgi:pyrroloquinoline quinone (PQQ) biosynthesis protein C
MINFYPLIENFPKYMALILAKVPMEDSPEANMARHWLIHNLNIERLHAKWYRDWIRGFGVPQELMQKEYFPTPEVDAVNNFLWKLCTYGTLPEAIAGLNFAIEGPTGIWSQRVYENIRNYEGVDGVQMTGKSLIWLKAHAKYDDHHPDEALEIVKCFATNQEEQARVIRAAKNGMAYYAMAAEAGYSMKMTTTTAKVA